MKTALAIFAAIFVSTVVAAVALDALFPMSTPAAQCGCILDDDQ
jgi:hypothetical protein